MTSWKRPANFMISSDKTSWESWASTSSNPSKTLKVHCGPVSARKTPFRHSGDFDLQSWLWTLSTPKHGCMISGYIEPRGADYASWASDGRVESGYDCITTGEKP
ncbi:hypothetical protein VP1G_10926 [Cytospora mali]|uniref:Uncharacterized protein n=1 Tax=Cytospora mali TaxID=578113 RepID=A0A194UZN2_CYTMA|nr:hypothetical protein VP1G_10926 [Valsa mali var. pyri (nom. inval.)]